MLARKILWGSCVVINMFLTAINLSFGLNLNALMTTAVAFICLYNYTNVKPKN